MDKNEKKQSEEKTIFISSDSRKKNVDLDSTKIEDSSNETTASNSSNETELKSDTSGVKESTSTIENEKTKKTTLAVGAVAAVGGVAAGIAIGATNADRIKDLFIEPSSLKNEDKDVTNSDTAIVDTKEGNDNFKKTEQNIESSNHVNEEQVVQNEDSPEENEIDLISQVSSDSSELGECENVSDDQLSYVDEYPVAGGGFSTDEQESIIYEIQAGDTLSEIAQNHSTSVDHIIALNPEISDPNLIYAENDIIIPIGDNEANPYGNWQEGITETSIGNEIISTEDELIYSDGAAIDSSVEEYYEPSIIEVNETDEFAEVDWASFEDQPMSSISEINAIEEDFVLDSDESNIYATDDQNNVDVSNTSSNYEVALNETNFESWDYSESSSYDIENGNTGLEDFM
jgi:LysM repeat protein